MRTFAFGDIHGCLTAVNAILDTLQPTLVDVVILLMLRWEPFDDPPPHDSGKIMICGHTPQQSGFPKNLGYAICIDTCAHGGGWLSCLHIETGNLLQANQQAEIRRLHLADC